MTAVPVIPTAAVGQQISAGWWNTSAVPPIAFLMDPPKCDVYDNSGNSVSNAGSGSLISYDTEVSDTLNMHDPANPSRISYLYPGRYEINIFTMMPAATYTKYVVNLRLSSTGNPAGGTSIRSWDFSSPGGAPYQSVISLSRVFAVGDYTEVFAYQTSGASRTTSTAGLYCTGFQARWVSLS